MIDNFAGGKKNMFYFVFTLVALTLVGLSYWVITFVWGVVQDTDEEIVVDEAISAIYIDYVVSPDDYISPESYLAMAEYQQQFPQTQNVQVLQSLSTVEIIGYMINHMSAGMGVNCTHCHTLENFAADEWDDPVAMENKNTAREHLLMTADLNQQWLTMLPDLTELKHPSGAQITCAVCHNGQAQPIAWDEGTLVALPDDFPQTFAQVVLAADVQFTVADDDTYLEVNARDDISLDRVQINQYVMYHMNASMNVGCTHCHNSRWFPSYEVPAKYYSLNMLQMSQYLWQNYAETLGNQTPSCNMCHQGAVIPPGAARSVDVMPADLVPPPEGD